METQNQIKRTLSRPEAIEQIRALLDGNEDLTRSQVADRVCERFGFYDRRQQRQRNSCLIALRELEKASLIVLPASRIATRKPSSPIRLGQPVPLPRDVPTEAGEVRQLELILVETEAQMRLWNEMMIREHPRGASMLVGRQLRYLVASEHGWLGGFGFGASALQLQDRDRWIGWNAQTRRANLDQVVCMSRFLVRPSVCCRNLASRLLGMCMQTIGRDFQSRYGYEPMLVETFVDGLPGTCYRAANWIWVGRTQGRGRQDRLGQRAETVKDIYLYSLEKDFRRKLGLPENTGKQALDPAEGVDADNWAHNEFGNAPLGDTRLSRRLVEIARDKGEKPGDAYTAVVKGEWPKVKAYYRMIDQPEESAVTMANILAPHRERTIQRMQAQQTVLCIQDGTDLDYSSLSQCEGLGVIGTNQTGAQSGGLYLHSTMAITPDGLPLGILRAKCSAPEPKPQDDRRTYKEIPIEEKKTFCWIEGLRDCTEMAAQMPKTRLVSVMDREADFFELFEEHRRNPVIDLLVRAKHDRVTGGELKLFETVRQTPVRERLCIQVPRQSARPKKSKQKVRPKRAARTAEVSLRYNSVELPAPSHRPDMDPILLWIVHVSEDCPPADAEPIEWFLLTTMEIVTADDAVNCVRWYCKRWRIEDWHRVLKSGCRVEQAAHKTVVRLKRALAINLVIAWRIMLMTLLGRETPELPADVLFSDLEMDVLRAYAKKKPKTRRMHWAKQCD